LTVQVALLFSRLITMLPRLVWIVAV